MRLAKMPEKEQQKLSSQDTTVSLDLPLEAFTSPPSVTNPLGIATQLDLALHSHILTCSARDRSLSPVDVSLRLLVDRTNESFVSLLEKAIRERKWAAAGEDAPTVHFQDVVVDFLRRDGAFGSDFEIDTGSGASDDMRPDQDEDAERMRSIFGLGDSTGLWSASFFPSSILSRHMLTLGVSAAEASCAPCSGP